MLKRLLSTVDNPSNPSYNTPTIAVAVTLFDCAYLDPDLVKAWQINKYVASCIDLDDSRRFVQMCIVTLWGQPPACAIYGLPYTYHIP